MKMRIKATKGAQHEVRLTVHKCGPHTWLQVFVCHMKRGAQQPTIVTGPVLVTKKPAFHVGDVRVLQVCACTCMHEWNGRTAQAWEAH